MKLILARHGDTFTKGDKIFWVGAREDLPLTPSGIEQAHQLAKYLRAEDLLPDAIYAGTLSRTQQYAGIINAALGREEPVQTDIRLNEIDYGRWSGRTTAEITAQYGQDVVDDWNSRAIWPNNAEWQPSESQIEENARTFVNDTSEKFPNGKILAITSNGIMRFFLRLDESTYTERLNQKQLKTATGNFGVLEVTASETIVNAWNVKPADQRRNIS